MNNQQLHETAIKIMTAMKADDKKIVSSKDAVKSYNERRKAQRDALRPVLQEMDDRMKTGETFAGCQSMKDWCKQTGYYSYQQVRNILTNRTGNESKKGKVTLPKQGDRIRMDGVDYDVTSGTFYPFPRAAQRKAGVMCLDFILTPVKPVAEAQPAPKQKHDPLPTPSDGKCKTTHIGERSLAASYSLCGKKLQFRTTAYRPGDATCEECKRIKAENDKAKLAREAEVAELLAEQAENAELLAAEEVAQ